MFAIDFDAVNADCERVKDRLRSMVASLDTDWEAEVVMPAAEAQHLLWFDEGTETQPARPVLTLDDEDVQAGVEAIEARFEIGPDGRVNLLPALTVAASAIRARWVEALRAGGGRHTWAALSPLYAARKARRGQPATPGVASGSMATALASGQIILRRVR